MEMMLHEKKKKEMLWRWWGEYLVNNLSNRKSLTFTKNWNWWGMYNFPEKIKLFTSFRYLIASTNHSISDIERFEPFIAQITR